MPPTLHGKPLRQAIAVCAILASAIMAGQAHAERLPPFNATFVDSSAPMHTHLIGADPNAGHQITAVARELEIREGTSVSEAMNISFVVPIFWENEYASTNAALVLSRTNSLLAAAQYLTSFVKFAKNPAEWCTQLIATGIRQKAQVEYPDAKTCERQFRGGLRGTTSPQLDSVLIQSVSENASNPDVLISLQYICTDCRSTAARAGKADNLLFQVQALVRLNPRARFTIKSLATPALLKR
jgi:hypothetical protein